MGEAITHIETMNAMSAWETLKYGSGLDMKSITEGYYSSSYYYT